MTTKEVTADAVADASPKDGAQEVHSPSASKAMLLASPDEIELGSIKELMTSKYTRDLTDRHVAALRKVASICCNGFLLRHLEALVELLEMAVQRFSEGQLEFATVICDFARVASQPFVSCKMSDMISYGHFLPPFLKVLVSSLQWSTPPTTDGPNALEDPEGRKAYEERRSLCERVRVEISHTLSCWSRFGLDEDSMEQMPREPLIQAVADQGTPNLRILLQSDVMGHLAASFHNEDSPEAIVITLGAIRDMSLYRPLARQITNCGLIANVVHVIRVNLLGSDVLLVAAEVLWNLLELDWEGAAIALGNEETIDSFRDFMHAVLARGYRFKDKIFRNDMMVLLMYVSKRPENRPLFAQTGLMALLLSYGILESKRRQLIDSGSLAELLKGNGSGGQLPPWQGFTGASSKASQPIRAPMTNAPEDMEFRVLLWNALARCCSSPECAEVANECGFISSLLCCLDNAEPPFEMRTWSPEQKRKVQMEALETLFQLVQHMPDAFLEAKGCDAVLQLLQATRSREVQKKCLHTLQAAVGMGLHFTEVLGRLGAVGAVIEIFTDKENSMSSRQLCASVLAGLCKGNPENCREFRKKDGVEAIREEVVYHPDHTTDNHLYYTLSIIDCIWNAIVGTRKNEARFLDGGGLFALLDVLEVAPLLLKRQITGCLADLMQYRKAAKLFQQWNSQVTMKGAMKVLLELWQSEQEAANCVTKDGVIRVLDHPLNPPPEKLDLEEDLSPVGAIKGGRISEKIQHAKGFADSLNGAKSASSPIRHPQQDADAFEASLGKQDCRAKIHAVLKKVDFESHEALTIGERQRLELVQFYPEAMQLETWVKVRDNLAEKGIKPVAADNKWIEDSLQEHHEHAESVMEVQKSLAKERYQQELASLDRFYQDSIEERRIQTGAVKSLGPRTTYAEDADSD